MAAVVGVTAVAALAALLAWWLSRATAGAKKLSPTPGSHWLFGAIPALATQMAAGAFFEDVIRQYFKQRGARMMALQLRLQTMALVRDPELVREALITKNLPKGINYKRLIPVVGPNSLVLAPHDVWRKQRRAFAPAFTPAFLRGQLPTMQDRVGRFLENLEAAAAAGDVPLRLHRAATMLTADIIMGAVLSQDWGLQDLTREHELIVAFEAALQDAGYWMENIHLAWMADLPWNKARTRRLQERLDGILLPAIKKGIASLQQPAGAPPAGAVAGTRSPPQNILACAIEAARSEGDELNMTDLLSQVKTFVFAGHDTTASTIAWCIYAVTQHPEVERKIVEELQRVLGDADVAPTADQLAELTYLTAVIKEVLRLYPPGSTARYCGPGSPGATLGGYDVAHAHAFGKVSLFASAYVMHTDAGVWGEDVMDFRPERWLDGEAVGKLHPCSYMPFSKGPRDCIGQHFAMLEARVALAMTFRRFAFEYAGEQPECMVTVVTNKPKYGVPVRVKRRSST